MGGTVNAAEAAVRNAQGSAQGAAAAQKQGVLDGRQVTDQRQGTDGPFLRERQQAGVVSGNSAKRTGLHSRQATEVSPTSPGTESATERSPGDRTGEPPATSATAAPLGSASASIDPTDRLAQVLTPPDLEPIVLTNAQGVTLFRGVRHGLLKSDGLDLPLLKSLPDNQLRSLLEQVHSNVLHASRCARSSIIARYVKTIRETDSIGAETHLRYLQIGVRRHLAEEVAVAALSMHPQKCEKALNKENVDLHLCAVSLTGLEANGVLQRQAQDLDTLTLPRPDGPGTLTMRRLCLLDKNSDYRSHELRLRDPDGVQQTVLAKISVRHFALSSAGESFDPFRDGGKLNQPKYQLEQLLRPIGGNRLTGDAGKQVDAIDARAHNHTLIETELKSLTSNSHTLVEAGAQLKATWAERGDWPPGADAHLRAAALIALVTHHMGETPLLISGDSGVTERLEAEITCLARYADSHDGHLPPFDSRVRR